ncbi:hypothetical protein XM38_001520 [Halomicronema hongdechloris C2206]|uniref:Uncharacterized protein n=1 Tax=Halomicronema hongdechloris C2206 TaxID=1641165 RepID=A0A1Z3HG38_9CYAN|nr:hypothetical protein [Halomicronema hongdechloris]ASC69226.1 hypothetical protein XM38_001520 [Halomicronema hongdechloris C2206]
MSTFTPASQTATAPVNGFIPQANQWVRLRDRISEYSAEEALLLCENADGSWVAWVPDHGETQLQREQLLKL